MYGVPHVIRYLYVPVTQCKSLQVLQHLANAYYAVIKDVFRKKLLDHTTHERESKENSNYGN